MKRVIVFAILLSLLCSFSFGQNINNTLFLEKAAYFLNIKSIKSVEKINQLFSFCQELARSKSRFKYDKDFLKYAFRKLHRKFLKQYKAYSTLDHLLARGQYDCVSGSTLYALIFESLGYQVSIKETPFHVYLLVDVKSGRVLVESTNYAEGFITKQLEIDAKEDYFKKLHRQETLRIYNRTISIKELAGLQYYNFALFHFKKKLYNQAESYLIKAKGLYEIGKITGLLELVRAKRRFASKIVKN